MTTSTSKAKYFSRNFSFDCISRPVLVRSFLDLSHATYLENVNKDFSPAVPKLRPCHRTPGQFNESCFLTCENSRFKRGVFQRVFSRFLRLIGLQKGRTVFWILNGGLWAANFDLTYLWNSVKFRVRCVLTLEGWALKIMVKFGIDDLRISELRFRAWQ